MGRCTIKECQTERSEAVRLGRTEWMKSFMNLQQPGLYCIGMLPYATAQRPRTNYISYHVSRKIYGPIRTTLRAKTNCSVILGSLRLPNCTSTSILARASTAHPAHLLALISLPTLTIRQRFNYPEMLAGRPTQRVPGTKGQAQRTKRPGPIAKSLSSFANDHGG